MARQKRALPGAHVLVKIAAQLRHFTAEAVEFGGRNIRPRQALQVGQFPLQFFDFFFSRFRAISFVDRLQLSILCELPNAQVKPSTS